MSILNRKTERAAIVVMAGSLKYFEKLNQFLMSAQDAADARQAENLIRAIIETNGYGLKYSGSKGFKIYKK
jgi:hypothetical protein